MHGSSDFSAIKRHPLAAPLRTTFALIILVLLIIFVYVPGLSGSFHFDDFPNLEILANHGPINSLETLLLYLDERVASSIGRPLSVLTFLLQREAWPDAPDKFLAANVALHAMNAALLFALTLSICSNSRNEGLRRKRIQIAFVSTALWSCNPFLVSTTLYVVQRMTLLSTTFVLVGLLLFVLFRIASETGTKNSGSFTFISGLGILGCGVLATLAKENGVLLFPLLLVTEYFLIRPFLTAGKPFRSRQLLLVIGWIPSILLGFAFFLGYFFPPLIADVQNGSLAGLGKLVVQPLAFFYYIGNLLFARPDYVGLYYDGHPLTAWSEIWPIAIAGVLLAAAVFWVLWRYRHRAGLLFFSACFFLIAISIELLHPGLEPVFEHRAYLPSVFLFYPIAVRLTAIGAKAISVTAIVVLLFWYSGSAVIRAERWGHPSQLKEQWASQNDYSTRSALAWFYDSLYSGNYFGAQQAVSSRREDSPDHPHVVLMEYELARVVPVLVPNRDDLVKRFAAAQLNKRSYEVAERLYVLARSQARFNLGQDKVVDILTAWVDRIEKPKSSLAYLVRSHRLAAALQDNDFNTACQDARFFVDQSDNVNHLIGVAVLFAQQSAHADALALLGIAKQNLDQFGFLRKRLESYYRGEIEMLKNAFLVEAGGGRSELRCQF